MANHEESIHEFDKLFDELVIEPWKVECAGAEYPWRATDNLRSSWIKNIGDKNPLVSLVGAVGLARCTCLSEKEIRAVEEALLEIPEEMEIVLDDVAVLLVTGGTPPPILWEAYTITPEDEADAFTREIQFRMVSAILRHPNSSPLAAHILGTPSSHPSLKYWAFLNPALQSPPSIIQNFWWEAAQIFHPVSKPKEPEMDDHLLKHLAWVLRLDHDRLPKSKSYDPVISELLSNHPCVRGKAPAFDHRDPKKEAFNYLSNDDSVSCIWRWYNPLLALPWTFEDIENFSANSEFLSLLLVGMVPSKILEHPIFDQLEYRSILEVHPAWPMTALGHFNSL